MLYADVVKQFRLRKGSLERYYQIQDEWRAVEFGDDYQKNERTVLLGSRNVGAHRVIACLKYKVDAKDYVKVMFRDNNKSNLTTRNVIIQEYIE